MAAPFEGPEKKLEIILAAPMKGLRSGSESKWKSVAHACGAEIISNIKTKELDAYLLSESSLFVWDDRILMITCGRTRLVKAVPEILTFVPPGEIVFFFYERKNLMYPKIQPSDFENDVASLVPYFPGKSYRLGPANHDHIHIFYYSAAPAPPGNDTTFEILMHDLPEDVIDRFHPKAGDTAESLEKRTGINRLLAYDFTDRHLFTPYGYSVNCIQGSTYVTAHVTPEPDGSYASFETNHPDPLSADMTSNVLDIFRPGRFSLVLTESITTEALTDGKRLFLSASIPGYSCREKSLYEFDSGYAVQFLNFTRNHS